MSTENKLELAQNKEVFLPGISEELETIGTQLENVPENLSLKKRKRIEEKLLLVLGPLIMVLGAAVTAETELGGASSFEILVNVTRELGGTATIAIGLSALFEGLRRYAVRTSSPILEKVDQLVDTCKADRKFEVG